MDFRENVKRRCIKVDVGVRKFWGKCQIVAEFVGGIWLNRKINEADGEFINK